TGNQLGLNSPPSRPQARPYQGQLLLAFALLVSLAVVSMALHYSASMAMGRRHPIGHQGNVHLLSGHSTSPATHSNRKNAKTLQVICFFRGRLTSSGPATTERP